MFELTNEQRKCFGLLPVDNSWIRIEPKSSPHDQHTTIAYLDGTVLRKVIQSGNNIYTEYEICERLSEDLQYLLPKTGKGKPVLFSSSALEKRTGFGMCLSYLQSSSSIYIDLYSLTSQQTYYTNDYEPIRSHGMFDFQQWVENWCKETTQDDIANISRFAARPRRHVKFHEGDVFLFKINRRLYGYGRILLDYTRMRKDSIPFWDILMGKPLACSVYHIATDRDDVSVEELRQLPSLPSVHIMDNRFFYGEHRIIGNIPVSIHEDYPIMYGGSFSVLYQAALLQCGTLYRRNDSQRALFDSFSNQSIGFDLKFNLSILLECIRSGSNAPYWAQDNLTVNRDLRNPKFRSELEQICKQFDIAPSQLIK